MLVPGVPVRKRVSSMMGDTPSQGTRNVTRRLPSEPSASSRSSTPAPFENMLASPVALRRDAQPEPTPKAKAHALYTLSTDGSDPTRNTSGNISLCQSLACSYPLGYSRKYVRCAILSDQHQKVVTSGNDPRIAWSPPTPRELLCTPVMTWSLE